MTPPKARNESRDRPQQDTGVASGRRQKPLERTTDDVTNRERDLDPVDEASEESFPASDPPARTPMTGTRSK